MRRVTGRLLSSTTRAAAWTGVICLLMAINGYAAETVNETAPIASEVVDQLPAEAAPETELDAAPAEILGGTGLKDRKLSEVFERFVPSESISADNAVPFPVDI